MTFASDLYLHLVLKFILKGINRLNLQLTARIWRLIHLYAFNKCHNITKTRLYSFDSLGPHFYTVKLGFTGVYIIFIIFARKHRLWVLVRTGSNEYPQSMFWAKIWKISEFLSENCHFLVVKCSVYLNRLVFEMIYRIYSKCMDTLTRYQTSPKLWTNVFFYLLTCL